MMDLRRVIGSKGQEHERDGSGQKARLHHAAGTTRVPVASVSSVSSVVGVLEPQRTRRTQKKERIMANEKTQGTGTLPPKTRPETPGENTVQITFLPEGEHMHLRARQTLPTKIMAKKDPCSTSRSEFRHPAGSRLRRQLRLHHLPHLGEGRRREPFRDGRQARPTGWTWLPICS